MRLGWKDLPGISTSLLGPFVNYCRKKFYKSQVSVNLFSETNVSILVEDLQVLMVSDTARFAHHLRCLHRIAHSRPHVGTDDLHLHFAQRGGRRKPPLPGVDLLKLFDKEAQKDRALLTCKHLTFRNIITENFGFTD
jgi:hypothetical protein